MNKTIQYLLLAAVAGLTAFAATSAVADKDKDRASGIITVYIAEDSGSGITKEMNATHARMEAAGYRFADMEIHSEDSDTQGVLITYVR